MQLVASPAADPGAGSSGQVEIANEIIITMVILLLTLIQEVLFSVASESMCTK